MSFLTDFTEQVLLEAEKDKKKKDNENNQPPESDKPLDLKQASEDDVDNTFNEDEPAEEQDDDEDTLVRGRTGDRDQGARRIEIFGKFLENVILANFRLEKP